MGRAAIARGYEYIAICDHTPAVGAVPGLTPDDVRRQGEEIAAANEVLAPFRVLRGIECDILPDGRLDLPDDVLAELDWVQASVHGGQRMPRAEMTARVVAALEQPARQLPQPPDRAHDRPPPGERGRPRARSTRSRWSAGSRSRSTGCRTGSTCAASTCATRSAPACRSSARPTRTPRSASATCPTPCTPRGAAGRRPPTCSTRARSTGCADAAECRAMTALESLDLPNPEFTPAQAIALVREHWGIEAEVSEVGSTQDQNFRATVRGRAPLRAQDREPGLAARRARVPERRDGAPRRGGSGLRGAGAGRRARRARDRDRRRARRPARHMGRRARRSATAAIAARRPGAGWARSRARAARGLEDFEHPELDRPLQWDPRRSAEVVDALADAATPEDAPLVERAMAPFASVLAAGDVLPVQPIHCDVTDFNTVAPAGGPVVPDGLLDFGDVCRTWRIGDPAERRRLRDRARQRRGAADRARRARRLPRRAAAERGRGGVVLAARARARRDVRARELAPGAPLARQRAHREHGRRRLGHPARRRRGASGGGDRRRARGLRLRAMAARRWASARAWSPRAPCRSSSCRRR